MVSSSGKNEPLGFMDGSDCANRMFRGRSFPASKALCVMDTPFHPKRDQKLREGPVVAKTVDTTLTLHKAESMVASETAIRLQLERIVESKIFVQSERLSRFLRFIVEHVLRGDQNCLKEYVIGSEVYDRKPPYHPSQDSIVRTEGRRLRSKLREYYEAEGKDDPVYVYLRPGSYIPAFQYRDALIGARNKTDIHDQILLPKSSGVAIAILPFSDLSGNSISSAYARGIPDEFAYILMRTKGYRVISPSITAHLNTRDQDIAAGLRKFGAQIAFEGSVRSEGCHIRVTAKIVDADGFLLWAQRIDVDAGSESSFALEEQIASTLSLGLYDLFEQARSKGDEDTLL
jgi:TolB-like protein